MKKLLILTISLLIFSNHVHAKDEGIILDSDMIHFIDGKSFGVNAKTIKLMLQVRREMKRLLLGEQTKSGNLEGHYLFNESLHSIRSLATIESKYEAHFYQQEESLTHDIGNHQRELANAGQQYNELKHQLRALLLKVKQEFEAKLAPFAKSARGAKGQMLVLIAESCGKRHRPDSLLLKWADTAEGDEMKFFQDQIVSFRTLDQFCSDLVNFLEDLMHSCPKAMAEFKKLMDEQHAKNNAHH